MNDKIADIERAIISSNIEVHKIEASIYDLIHPEIFGSYEQKETNNDLDFISARLPRNKAICALDVGCGTGNLVLKYLARGYDVHAVDLSSEMIDRLRTKLPAGSEERIQLLQGNAEEVLRGIRPERIYDIISFSSVLHHLPDYRAVLSLALARLRPGGFLWVCHEPIAVIRGELGFVNEMANKAIESVDGFYIISRKALVYLANAIVTGRKPKRIDYRFSDFHAKEGIPLPELIRFLENQKTRILFSKTYNSRFSSILARIDNWREQIPRAHFRLIVQQQTP